MKKYNYDNVLITLLSQPFFSNIIVPSRSKHFISGESDYQYSVNKLICLAIQMCIYSYIIMTDGAVNMRNCGRKAERGYIYIRMCIFKLNKEFINIGRSK